MRFFVVMMIVCLLDGNVQAQGEAEKKAKKLSLVELITESEMVYRLIEVKEPFAPTWKALVGNKYAVLMNRSAPIYSMGEDKIKAIKQYMDGVNKTKAFSPGILTLYFWSAFDGEDTYFSLWNYSADFYLQLVRKPIPERSIKFPKYDGLRDDLIWLCRHRHLLQLLKKGELSPDIYHFSPRELQFLVMVCPDKYLKNLHVYAESDMQGDKLATIYQFMD